MRDNILDTVIIFFYLFAEDFLQFYMTLSDVFFIILSQTTNTLDGNENIIKCSRDNRKWRQIFKCYNKSSYILEPFKRFQTIFLSEIH